MCTIDASTGVVSFVAAGTCRMQATSSGCVSTAQSITVVVGSVTMSRSGNSTSGAFNTVTTSVPAAITSLTPTVCTVVRMNVTTSIVSLLAPGDCTLKAVALNGGTDTTTFRVAGLPSVASSSTGLAAGDDATSSSSTGATGGISGVSSSRDGVNLWLIAALQALALMNAAIARQA